MKTQYAVQLIGKDRTRLNTEKEVFEPGPHQISVKSEAVGLCFSDMKLLAQFDDHVRKSAIVAGVDPEVLAALPSYAPGSKPTVPGHELCVRVERVGEGVSAYKPGERWLVQPDFRRARTATTNGACGYNFEGALQEFVLLDERILGDPSEGDAYMMPAPESLSRSAIALIEPWACVENSYVTQERRGPKPGGKLLVIADEERDVHAPESEITQVRPDALPEPGWDDVIYFGHDPKVIEAIEDLLAGGGIANVVLGGSKIGRPVEIGVGRIHYGGTRWVGTVGDDPAKGYAMIPETGELRRGDKLFVVGAGGPMGQMHVIRAIAMGVETIASDLSDERLEGIVFKAKGVGMEVTTHHPQRDATPTGLTYVALMAPVPELVAAAVRDVTEDAIVNVFAGIPIHVKHAIDLDALIAKRTFVFGTSGSEPEDMRTVLGKVIEGTLDVNVSVSAVSGMRGAEDGLRAVKDRSLDGKIVVYPELREMGLVPLKDLRHHFPTVAEKMPSGIWNKAAEDEFLKVAR